jgi:hypothetical protein
VRHVYHFSRGDGADYILRPGQYGKSCSFRVQHTAHAQADIRACEILRCGFDAGQRTWCGHGNLNAAHAAFHHCFHYTRQAIAAVGTHYGYDSIVCQIIGYLLFVHDYRSPLKVL